MRETLPAKSYQVGLPLRSKCGFYLVDVGGCRTMIIPMQTTMKRASIMAYSTAVGPSSLQRKFTNG
jgi:hypothetical protein